MTTRVKYYTDEHVSGAVVMGLRRRGVGVLTAQDAGMLGASDEEHINLARQREMVIFTSDADFLRLHAGGVAHKGIVYARQRTPVGEIIRGLMLIHQVLDASEMENHVEFL